MCQSFVHLHNHTEYSLLDGATRIPDMVSLAKEQGMPAMAISDHGVMFGALEFYLECKKQGVKPIIGMEAYVAPNGHLNKQGREENSTFHLLLLARNEEGYRNLCRLHSVAALHGFYYKPRVDHELLAKHSKGLIASTTCIGSEVNQALLKNDYNEALRIAGMYRDMFDPDCYFVELQDHGIAEQRLMNEGLVKIAKDLKLPMVVTNDAHYLCQSDAEPHDVLLCIGTGSLMADEKRMKFNGPNFYVKSAEEMALLFPQHPEAVENSLMIAEKCDLEIPMGRALMPDPDLPEGETPMTWLRKVAEKGLQDRVPNATDEAWDRLSYELGIIEQTGFESYFLLVREFANYTRSQGIAYGVRGSAAGSLVSYTVGITDVNPVEYDLTFERFLNPERVTMPDIDMDFEDARRDEVIKWVTEKYGQDRVAQIVTFGTLGPKAAIRDAARVMGYLPQDADRLCKTLPNDPKLTLKKALSEIHEFKQMVGNDPNLNKLVQTAKSIEGISRHCGVHAAGVVISKDPLSDIIPLYKGNDGQAITAYEMGMLEKIGLLKMDFLGLSNLTVVSKAIENIREQVGNDPKLIKDHPVLDGILNITLDDEGAYEMLGKGDTTGVFQLESGGMRRNIMELKPQNVRELAAMVALYRPGPMGEIPKFVRNKHGLSQPEYLHELMEPILRETYGIIVYQDQVLKLVQSLAGFSLGKADLLRRAMGKKDKKIMDQMMPQFYDGCEERGIPKETAEKVWELLIPFADYAFNKAHAVCYAILAYQTAYLKANYPVEYMTALMAVYRGKADRLINFIEECRRKKIEVLPPDINASGLDFRVEKKGKEKAIRFGLAAIKGVGGGLVVKILEERRKEAFTHLYEFCERMRPHGLNRTALDALIKAGALTSINKNRATLLEHMEGGLSYADVALREKMAGQDSLFGGGDDDQSISLPTLPEVAQLARPELLAMEKEVMGIYISDHPLKGLEKAIAITASHTCVQIEELEVDVKVTLAGVISGARTIITKAGHKMAEITLEDFSGQTKCIVYKDAFAKFGHLIEKDSVIVLTGFVSQREQGTMERQVEVRVQEVKPLPMLHPLLNEGDSQVEGTVLLRVRKARKKELYELKDVVEANPGNYEVAIHFVDMSDMQPMILLDRVKATREVVRQLRNSLDDCEADLIGGDYALDQLAS